MGRRRRRRRLPRILLNAATAILLLLSAGALILGTWTHREPREVQARTWTVAADRTDRLEWFVWCGRGRMLIERAQSSWWGSDLDNARKVAEEEGPGWTWIMTDFGPGWSTVDDAPTWVPIRWGVNDFRLDTYARNGRSASVSFWFLALVGGAWPLATLATFIYRRRRASGAAGRCRHCGYDLRATPDRCPECGAVPAAPSA